MISLITVGNWFHWVFTSQQLSRSDYLEKFRSWKYLLFLLLQGDKHDLWTNPVFKEMPVPFVWCADTETEHKRLSAETDKLPSLCAEGCLLVLLRMGKNVQRSGAWRKFHSLYLVSSNIGPLTPQRSLMWNNLNYFLFCLHLTDMKSIPFSPNWETFAGLDLRS